VDQENGQQERSTLRRIAPVLVVVLLLVGAAAVLLDDDGYRVKARFAAATAIVEGNLVVSGGRPVGTVKSIELTDDGFAELELAVDEELAPLPEGTRAVLRIPSLSSQAGRYVDLRLPEASGTDGRAVATIPDGGTIDARATTSAVDVDQFFDLFDERTRAGLRKFVRGQGTAYDGRARDLDLGYKYLNPSLVAATNLFDELNRDTPLLQRFLVQSSRLVTDLADRDESLAALVDRFATATGAIAAEEQSLSRAVGTLPPFLRRANTTFSNLRSTLDVVDGLVEDSKPVAPRLRAVLAQLRPFAAEAEPTVRDLAALAGRSGRANDLLDLARVQPALRDIATATKVRNGKPRPGALPQSVESLKKQTPELSALRSYAVDLTGWFDDFSHTGAYDANQSFNRSALTTNAFSTANGVLAPIPPELRQQLLEQALSSGQVKRCPGSIERGAVVKPEGVDCDPTQVPRGR
jgi:phospholipid/cholesterol/gamma-HCH transport system substrate-binding protein